MLGIFIGLAVLMFLAYKGMSIIWVAPIAAMIVALTGGLELLPAYTINYMQGFANYAQSWFPAFMLGAIFGKLMDVSGAARSIAEWLTKRIGARRAMLAVVVSCGVLTYGGISLFVVVFVMYPMGLALFREANITRRLLPGAIALGAFTFTMTAVPGTPQIQNLIPMEYFGTTPTAAPIMGIVAALIMFIIGLLWLQYRANKYKKSGILFTEPKTSVESETIENLPPWYIAIIPPLAVILLFNLVKVNIVVALLGGILFSIALFIKKLLPSKNLIKVLNEGANGSLLAILNTSAAVGFGTVVRAVPGFQSLTNLMLGTGGSPLLSEAVAVNVLAGATGSASGGMGIALAALGEKYMQIATEVDINPEALHRIASLSSGGLDTLPQNGAVLTLLAVTAMSHKESYLDIFMCCTVFPLVSVAVAIIMGTLGIV